MARTYEETIFDATVDAVNDALAQPVLPTPDEIKGNILDNSRNEVTMYNSIAQQGAKWKVPVELETYQIAYIMLRVHYIALIETTESEDDADCSLLGVYMEDGEDEGIYTTKDSEIRRIARLYKRRITYAFKREKTHSLLHEHILSGIIKCPVCGSSMYGVVNRKKKKGSDEFYTDMWYYLCKNRKMVSGHLCDYKKHIRQDEINTEVIQLVKYVFCGENDMKDQILKKLGSDDSLSELLQEKERLTKEHEKLDSKKSKQLRRINELDIDDELYDDLMKTYRAGVQEINEQIAIIENQMYQNDLSIENAQGENLSAEVYKRIIDEMLDHIDDMPDSDKKLMMNLLIEKVEIYEEKQKDGRWVKSVQFKIPLNVDGKLVDTMFFDDEDTENSLSNEKHVETVVLMSKVQK